MVHEYLIPTHFSVQIKEIWRSGYLFNPVNYMTLALGFTLLQFPAYAWIIEKLAGAGYLPDPVVSHKLFPTAI